MKYRLVFCVSLVVSMATASATDIYRWVDETGRTHVSDQVPAKYRDSAIRLDSRRFDVPAVRPQDAAIRGTPDLAPANKPANSKSDDQVPGGVISVEPAAADKRQAAEANNDCQALRRRYSESQECFAPYFVKGGGIRTEAFEKCGQPVPDPAPKCGIGPTEE